MAAILSRPRCVKFSIIVFDSLRPSAAIHLRNEWHLPVPSFKLNNTLGHPHYGFSNDIVIGEMACPTFLRFCYIRTRRCQRCLSRLVEFAERKHDSRAWKIDKSTIFVGWRPDNDVTKLVHESYQLVHESSQLIIHSNACAVWQWKRLRSHCEFSTAGKNFQNIQTDQGHPWQMESPSC